MRRVRFVQLIWVLVWSLVFPATFLSAGFSACAPVSTPPFASQKGRMACCASNQRVCCCPQKQGEQAVEKGLQPPSCDCQVTPGQAVPLPDRTGVFSYFAQAPPVTVYSPVVTPQETKTFLPSPTPLPSRLWHASRTSRAPPIMG